VYLVDAYVGELVAVLIGCAVDQHRVLGSGNQWLGDSCYAGALSTILLIIIRAALDQGLGGQLLTSCGA
jgi:hypothetical protein